MQLDKRRIVVTGGARGIGEAVVRAYAAEGARIASLDVLDDTGRAVVDAANAAGPGRAHYYRCDVSDRRECADVFTEAADWLGGIDALVHVAGVERTAPAEDIDDADWDLMMDVNARGTMNTNQAVFPYLKDAGGRILNFGSAAGVHGMPGGAAYSASKGAVLAWTRTLAQEWGKYRITVNAIAPGIWTPMYEAHRGRMSPDELEAHDKGMASRVLLGGKLGDPVRDLAPVMVFLVTDGASFITGQTIPVDGGMLILS